MGKWRDIWQKDQRVNDIILECLIKADGFDSAASGFSVDGWISYTRQLHQLVDIREGETVYDVGCGSGAFVYPLYLSGHRVGGIDYSSALIRLANKFFDKADFVDNEAAMLDADTQYDIVLSHSVFHYFDDLAYAKDVVRKMARKSRRSIAILDINDAAKQDVYHQTRMKDLGPEEYEKKYRGLNHLFYEKRWFEELASELSLTIRMVDQQFEKYANSNLRFNVIMEK